MVAAEVNVNGRTRSIADVPTHTTVLDFVRGLELTGCKEGCAEGECGACAVLVARPGVTAPTEWIAVNACLVPIAALDGQEVITSEGLGTPEDPHAVQYEMAVRGGSQCGYCTPGFVCSMAAEYYRPDREQDRAARLESPARLESAATGASPAPESAGDGERGPNGFDLHALSGNLCRCTGYRPIRDAAFAVGAPSAEDALAARRDEPANEPTATEISRDGKTFARPPTLVDAVRRLREHPEVTIAAGCTDLGVEVNIRGSRPEHVVAVDRIPELRTLDVGEDEIELGAALTLTEIERHLDGAVPLLDRLLPQFASRLIRNGATLGGNLGTGSPIGDSPPVLLALEARLVLADADGEREVALADYFTGYRRSVRRPDELIRAVRVPRPLSAVTAFHKIAKRRFDDISSIAAAFAVELDGGRVRKARIGLGGVAATPVRALDAEAALEGEPWTAETVRAAARVLAAEGTPMDDHRASSAYRSAMLGQSLWKLHAESTQEVPA